MEEPLISVIIPAFNEREHIAYALRSIEQQTYDRLESIVVANACSDDYSIKRYVRDAKIMEIIEGSTEIQYLLISKYGYQQR